MITPAGHYLGRKPDSADPRDHRFMQIHGPSSPIALPPAVDLRAKLPPAFDQGNLGSCGANSGDGLMCFLFPEIAKTGFSRLKLYYDVRTIENTVAEDAGVETRDVLKVLADTGAAPETMWPYDVNLFATAPPADAQGAAAKYKLQSYSRLIADQEFLTCLAQGFPFLLGIECYSSIDSDALAKSGVMAMPDVKNEQIVGGHDVLVVGYDLNFKASADFKKSGVDPALVSDQALLIRNSWGADWGLKGHFWMPLPYASNPSTGGDAWTGRRTAPPKMAAAPPIQTSINPTPAQLNAAFKAARKAADDSGWGGWIKDEACRSSSAAVAKAVLNAH
jgi:C1A family cysteine protease